MAKRLVILGGILALISLLFTWWIAYYGSGYLVTLNTLPSFFTNSSNFSHQFVGTVSPVYFGDSPGVPLNQTSLGISAQAAQQISGPLIQLVLLLVVAGGFIGILSGLFVKKSIVYETAAGVLVISGALLFAFTISDIAGTWVLFGNESFGISLFWILGPGFWIALASALILLLSNRLHLKRASK